MTHSRSNNQSRIAILFGVIAMPLLCALVSCGGEKKEIVDVGFDPDSSYTMKATQIVTMVSDSGITRYKVVTAEWLMFDEAEEPYWFFPEKVHLEKFDSLFRVEASVDADTAYYYKRKELWKLSGNVRVKNLEGEQFETELLFWDDQGKKVYSDRFIRITKGDFCEHRHGLRVQPHPYAIPDFQCRGGDTVRNRQGGYDAIRTATFAVKIKKEGGNPIERTE